MPDGDAATCCSDLMKHTYAGVHETCHKLDAIMREQQSKVTFTEITTNKVNKTAPMQGRESHYAGGGEPPVSRGTDLTYFQSIYNDLTKFYFKTI